MIYAQHKTESVILEALQLKKIKINKYHFRLNAAHSQANLI